VQEGAVGKAGNVNITAGSLSITDGAAIDALTFGQGDAGNVNIQAATTISLDGFSNDSVSHIGSTVEARGTGRGGEINLSASSLNLTNGAQINSSATTVKSPPRRVVLAMVAISTLRLEVLYWLSSQKTVISLLMPSQDAGAMLAPQLLESLVLDSFKAGVPPKVISRQVRSWG